MSTYFSGADAGTYPGYYGPGGSVTVGASAELLGVTYGISMAGVGTVDNFGIVESESVGIDLAGGGSVTNALGGTIYAPLGIHISGGVGYVTNNGSIRSTKTAIYFSDGGSVDNGNSGSIMGPQGIHVDGGMGSVTNYGHIGYGAGIGVYLGDGGTITNAAQALINGTIGVEIGPGASGTLFDDGFIKGGIDSVRFDSASDVLVIGYSKYRAGFEGMIDGGGGTLVMDDGSQVIAGLGNIGTLYNIGTLSGFGAYVIGSSAELVLFGYNGISDSQSLINDGIVNVNNTLVVAGSIGGDGKIEIGAGATLSLAGGTDQPIYFQHPGGGVLELAQPGSVISTLYGFFGTDVIDLTSVAYSAADAVTYEPGHLTVTDGTATVASFTLGGVELPGAVFAVEPDGKHGIDIVLEQSVGNFYLKTSPLEADQVILFNAALLALSNYVAQTEGISHPELNFYAPLYILEDGRLEAPISGHVNIENGYPITADEMIELGTGAQGAVLVGSTAATLVGHAGAEFLVGNAGNDTIRAAGGSGTVISGTGRNEIYTGSGDVVVSSGGDDTIYSGKSGVSQITALGNATVHAGGGFTSFTDSGTTTSADKVKGGGGTTVMNSGLGQDTFVGGSGTSFMNDTGSGRVALVFSKGVGGTDIVTGFDPSNGDYIRASAASNGWSDFQDNISVIGGSSFVNLADGTKIEFVGFTSLSAADFHG